MNYVEYDPTTGEIFRTGNCQVGMLHLQAGDGMDVVEGLASLLTHHVMNGVITPYSTEACDLKATRPTRPCVWNNSSMSWVNTQSIEDCKTQRWDAIKQLRDEARRGGFTWDGSAFDSDAISQMNIQGAAQLATLAALASQDFNIDWTLADNTIRNLSREEMIAVGRALGEHIAAAHEAGRVLRTQIDEASTTEEVEAIVWAN